MSELPYYRMMRRGGFFDYFESIAFAGMVHRYIKRGELEDIIEFYKPEHILKLYNKNSLLGAIHGLTRIL